MYLQKEFFPNAADIVILNKASINAKIIHYLEKSRRTPYLLITQKRT